MYFFLAYFLPFLRVFFFPLCLSVVPQQLKEIRSQPRQAPGWCGADLRYGSARVPRGGSEVRLCEGFDEGSARFREGSGEGSARVPRMHGDGSETNSDRKSNRERESSLAMASTLISLGFGYTASFPL